MNRRQLLKSLGISGALLLVASPALALKLSRHKKNDTRERLIPLTDKERCPVCGMFVKPFPKWITQIQFSNGSHHSFDGMKCLCRFYFNPEKYSTIVTRQDFQLILVRDYYTLHFIEHKQAYYVIGSDVFGPMGHELIPFVDSKAAKTFQIDHHGQKILRFDEITNDLLDLLDRSKKQINLDE
mgnify:CR=1 FL=1|jgi:copper chaperone NosL